MLWLLNFISQIFIILALGNFFRALKELEETKATLQKRHKAFFELHRCVRQQVTYHNQKEAIEYLQPFLRKEAKERLLLLWHQLNVSIVLKSCEHISLPGIYAAPHKQKNIKLHPLWPNWVPAFYAMESLS